MPWLPQPVAPVAKFEFWLMKRHDFMTIVFFSSSPLQKAVGERRCFHDFVPIV